MNRMVKWIAAPVLLLAAFAFAGCSQAEAGGINLYFGGYGGGYYGHRHYRPYYGHYHYRPYYHNYHHHHYRPYCW